MEKLQAFQAAASEGGFVATGESKEDTVMWLKKATVEAEDRICLDSLTNSATVYWATIPWKVNSKTFSEASALGHLGLVFGINDLQLGEMPCFCAKCPCLGALVQLLCNQELVKTTTV